MTTYNIYSKIFTLCFSLTMLSLSHFASATTISTPALLHFAPPASNLSAVEESWSGSGSLQSAFMPYLENENRLIIDLHSESSSFNEVIQKFFGNQQVFWFVNLELPNIPGMTSLGENQLIAQVFLISFYRYESPTSTGSDSASDAITDTTTDTTTDPTADPTTTEPSDPVNTTVVEPTAVSIDEPSTISLLCLSLMGFVGLITHRNHKSPIEIKMHLA